MKIKHVGEEEEWEEDEDWDEETEEWEDDDWDDPFRPVGMSVTGTRKGCRGDTASGKAMLNSPLALYSDAVHPHTPFLTIHHANPSISSEGTEVS